MGSAAGRVESVNVAERRLDLPVRDGRSGIDKRPVSGPVALTADGVAGDVIVNRRDHGGPDQAVYAYSTDDLAFWAAELGRAAVSHVGENLTVSGVDCSGAVIGERWAVGTAVLQVRGARTPCRKFVAFLDAPDLIKRFVAAGRPGAYLAVVQPGEVAAGDPVRVLDRPAHGVTTADLLAAKTVDRERADRVAAARAHLGARERAWLDGLLAARERGRRPAG